MSQINNVDDGKRYRIVRMYRDSGRKSKRFKNLKNMTLGEAQLHCRSPLTHKEGVWFDGYEEM